MSDVSFPGYQRATVADKTMLRSWLNYLYYTISVWFSKHLAYHIFNDYVGNKNSSTIDIV